MMGDFNVDVIVFKFCKYIRSLMYVIRFYGLRRFVKEFIRVIEYIKIVIDLVFVNNLYRIVLYGV